MQIAISHPQTRSLAIFLLALLAAVMLYTLVSPAIFAAAQSSQLPAAAAAASQTDPTAYRPAPLPVATPPTGQVQSVASPAPTQVAPVSPSNPVPQPIPTPPAGP